MASGFAGITKIPELRRRLLFTLAMLFVGQWVLTRQGRRRGQQTSMAGIVAQQG